MGSYFLSRNQTVLKSQLEAADRVLRQLSEELLAQFLGLITTSGQTIMYYSAAGFKGDIDSLASLASGSFAATRQLTQMMDDYDFSVMFQEGSRIKVYIEQVTGDVLLVICFGRVTELGKVRLLAARAARSLCEALNMLPDKPGSMDEEPGCAEGIRQAIDELFNAQGERRGAD